MTKQKSDSTSPDRLIETCHTGQIAETPPYFIRISKHFFLHIILLAKNYLSTFCLKHFRIIFCKIRYVGNEKENMFSKIRNVTRMATVQHEGISLNHFQLQTAIFPISPAESTSLPSCSSVKYMTTPISA